MKVNDLANIILRLNIKRFPKGLGMRHMNQGTHRVGGEKVSSSRNGDAESFQGQTPRRIVICYENAVL
jgi:hypothetical protein